MQLRWSSQYFVRTIHDLLNFVIVLWLFMELLVTSGWNRTFSLWSSYFPVLDIKAWWVIWLDKCDPTISLKGFFIHVVLIALFVGSGHHDCSRDGNIVCGPKIGGPFTLINTEKQTVTECNFLGNWVLLYFGYTSSPDIGPEQVQIMAKAIDILGLTLLSQVYRILGFLCD